jgi:hypothetical protein
MRGLRSGDAFSLLPTLVLAASVAAESLEPAAEPAEGLYEVKGATTVEATGDQRTAEGKFVLVREADGRFVASFNLKTVLPTPEGPRAMDITGNGEGRFAEGALTGTAEAQFLAASVGGLDPQFAFVPGRLGPRIGSRFVMRPGAAAGRYQVEIHSEGLGEAGRGYSPTATRLEAVRVGDKPKDGRLPLPKPRED